jgi:hypothetical protein
MQVHALFNNIQLDQSAVTGFGILDVIQFGPVQAVNVSDVSEPVFKWGGVVIGGSGSTNSTTIVVSANDNIRNFQVVDGVLKTSHEVEISVDDHVGDVTQDKNGSSILSHDDIARNTGIGTSCLKNIELSSENIVHVKLRSWGAQTRKFSLVFYLPIHK